MTPSRAARLALYYALFGALWILLSDQFIALIATPFEPSVLTHLQTLKGWLFVAVTAILLFFLLKSEIGQLEASEKSLKESNRRFTATQKRLEAFQSIINASPMVVCLWKNAPGWPVVMVSENAPQLFGHAVDAFISETVKYIDIVHPDDLDRISNEIVSFIKAKNINPFTQQYRIIAKDGTVKWVEDRTLTRRNDQGRITHFQGIVFDITDLKKEEQKNRDLQNQLLQAQKMESVGRLAGGVAHDFNNLLAVVVGYAELLMQNTPPDHPRLESLTAILDAAQRARNLTRQLLAFGRKQMLDIKVLDINSVIAKFEKLLARMLGDDITLELRLAVHPCLVKADVTQMEQLLMNLAVNARDAMPSGGTLTIETSAVHLDEAYASKKPDTPPGPYIMITMSDTGVGMERALIQYIFEPFFTTKDKEIGSGLGLSTVYGIVKQHGGNIWVYSEPGQGATFRIYLPRVQETAAAVETPPRPIPHANHQDASVTVLLVEDDAAVRDLTRTILERWGYKVLVAADAADAIDISQRHENPIDLLLTDVIMPGMKGPEVYARIVRFLPDIKVLYMSGYTENVILQNGTLEEGAHFIQKPFSINALADKVARIVFPKR